MRDLAREADTELDEAIVTLWDAGIDDIEDGGDVIPARLVPAARRALGLDVARDQMMVEYWVFASGLSRDELAQRMLEETGIRLPSAARRIPRGSLRRFRRMFAADQVVDADTKPAPVQLPPVEWKTVGKGKPIRYLTADEVAQIHEALEADFAQSSDPISPPGIRDRALLESAVTRPTTAFGDQLKYPTIEMGGAALFHSLVHNHPFHNGNKRTALVSLLAYLDENGLVPTCDQRDLFRFTLRVAQHRLVAEGADQLADREALDISRWVVANTRDLDHRERPMKWIRLKQRLREFNCEFEWAVGVGNRLNIVRTVPAPTRLRPGRSRTLHTQVACSGDGSEADRNTVHKIRADLELDDAHGCDSKRFYEGAEIDSFIIDYRRILQRLAKL